MRERERVYRAEAERCQKEIAKHRRAILKAEEWSAEHNDGQRDLGGRHFTEVLPQQIKWLEADANRFTRLANKAARPLSETPRQ